MIEFTEAQRQLGSMSHPQMPQQTYESIDQLFGSYTNPTTSVPSIPMAQPDLTHARIPLASPNRGPQRSPSKSVHGWELGVLAQPEPDRPDTIQEDYFVQDNQRPGEIAANVVRRKRKGGFTALDDGLPMQFLDNGESSDDIRSKFVTHPVDPRGLPPATIIADILDTFFLNFGCHYPFLSRHKVQAMLDQSNAQGVFVFNAMGAVSAR